MKYDLNINSAIGKDDLAPGMYPVIIYQLIRQYSNENNPLTLDDIMDTLSEYWKGDSKKESAKTNLQKTLKRNLEPLLYFDTNIHAEYGDGRTFFIESGDSIGKIKKIWYEQELSQTDIQLLSDSVVYSKHMPKKRRLELLEKIMRAGGQSTISHSEWYHNIIKDAEDTSIRVSGDLYNKLDYVNDAIQNKKCLSFDYSFSGPKQAKYKVRSYTRVSPYRIILESGIYYLVASRNPDEKRDSLFSEYNHSTPLVFLEIHKMDSIRTDGNKQDYQNICKTVGDKKTLQEIISAGYHPLTHEIIPFKFKEDLLLRVNSRGLDVLIDHFGNRLKITKRKEIDTNYVGSTPQLAYTYDVTIRNAAKNDWYELLVLLLQYPSTEIELISPQNLLRNVMFQMKNRLNRLGEKYTIQNLNEPSRPTAKPPYNE